MKLIFEQTQLGKELGIHAPEYAHAGDSGMDVYSPVEVVLHPGKRATVNLQIRFKIQKPWLFTLLNYFGIGLGVELHVRPRSGKSKNGIDVELGTIDFGYRGIVGATITNTTNEKVIIKRNEKICQIVVCPVFNNIKLINAPVDLNTSRGDKGFGSTDKK